MPGYIIHIAVGKEYLRKHKDEKNNEIEFLEGVIAPDGVEDKRKSHYGAEGIKTDLKLFLSKNKLETSYQKGYFLHLLTDYLFYYVYFHHLPQVYEDYDKLNKRIIEKYDLTIPEKAKKYAKYIEGEPKILKEEIIDKMIKDISDKSIQDYIDEIERRKQ